MSWRTYWIVYVVVVILLIIEKNSNVKGINLNFILVLFKFYLSFSNASNTLKSLECIGKLHLLQKVATTLQFNF